MKALELKFPPPALALLIASAMWASSLAIPLLELPFVVRMVAATVIAIAGGIIALLGAISLRRAKTTVNPMKPGDSSSLVTCGIYRLTRNPMYVGLLFVLVAWTIFLSSPWLIAGPLAFVLYMNRLQIVPEEKILSHIFGTTYSEYKNNVRRWL